MGVISASDFIHMLRRLKSAVSSGNNPLSEAEMDAHTVRGGEGHWGGGLCGSGGGTAAKTLDGFSER